MADRTVWGVPESKAAVAIQLGAFALADELGGHWHDHIATARTVLNAAAPTLAEHHVGDPDVLVLVEGELKPSDG